MNENEWEIFAEMDAEVPVSVIVNVYYAIRTINNFEKYFWKMFWALIVQAFLGFVFQLM